MKHFYRIIHLKRSPAASLAAALALLLVVGFIPFPEESVGAAAEPAGTVYLTFDDGPTNVTSEILDVLMEEEIKATFFVIGNDSDERLAILKRAYLEGHSIGVHTYSHNYGSIYASEDAFWQEIAQCADMVKSVTGASPTLLRFPGGSGNTVYRTKGAGGELMHRLTEACDDMGYSYHDWNVDTGDNLGTTLSAETVAERIIDGCKGKKAPVVLMHDSATATTGAAALRIAIPKLREMGFTFDTLDNIPSAVHQHLAG